MPQITVDSVVTNRSDTPRKFYSVGLGHLRITLGDYLPFGQLFEAFGDYFCNALGTFVKESKSYILLWLFRD